MVLKSQRKQVRLGAIKSMREGKGSGMNRTTTAKHHHPDPSVGVDVNLKLDRSLSTHDSSHNHDGVIEMNSLQHTMALIQRRETDYKPPRRRNTETIVSHDWLR